MITIEKQGVGTMLCTVVPECSRVGRWGRVKEKRAGMPKGCIVP